MIEDWESANIFKLSDNKAEMMLITLKGTKQNHSTISSLLEMPNFLSNSHGAFNNEHRYIYIYV